MFDRGCNSQQWSLGKLLDLEMTGCEKVLVKALFFRSRLEFGLPGWTFSLINSLLLKMGSVVDSSDFLLLSRFDFNSCPLLRLEGKPTSSTISVFPSWDGVKPGDIIFVGPLQSNDPSGNVGKCWDIELNLLENGTFGQMWSNWEGRGTGVTDLRFLMLFLFEISTYALTGNGSVITQSCILCEGRRKWVISLSWLALVYLHDRCRQYEQLPLLTITCIRHWELYYKCLALILLTS